MAGLLEALKTAVDENNKYIFYGAYVTVALGLLFNFIGMGTPHWVGADDYSYSPFQTHDDKSEIPVISDDVIIMLPVGAFIVCIGNSVIYWFIRKGGEKVWLLRTGGALVHYGGLLMIIAASLWGSHAKSDNSRLYKVGIELQYSFALSVTGATLISLAGPVMPFVYKRNSNNGNYVSIADSTSSSSSFYSSCRT